MKTCTRCQTEKPDSAFFIKNKKTGLRRHHCQTCQRLYQTEWHAKNRKKHNAQIRIAGEARIDWVRSLKEKPCTDCKKVYHYCAMDFDHRPGEKKDFNLNRVKTYSLKKLHAEIAKCDLVCANCHRIRTFKRIKAKQIYAITP